jgi:paraquat-inducible protein B
MSSIWILPIIAALMGIFLLYNTHALAGTTKHETLVKF